MRAIERETVRLAFVAAPQYLPPRFVQRPYPPLEESDGRPAQRSPGRTGQVVPAVSHQVMRSNIARSRAARAGWVPPTQPILPSR
jgi:hypothetical protein